MIARGGNNTWAPDVIKSGDQVLRLLLGARHAAEGRNRTAGGHGTRPGVAGLQMDGRWSGGLVGWRRGQQRDRSWRLPRSHEWIALAHLRLLLRLHPARRVESENRQAAVSGEEADQHRHQLRSVDHDFSRWLVLPAGDARLLLCWRELDLQHPHGPRQEGHGAIRRQHGHRHAPGWREAVSRLERPLHRPWPFRSPRSRRRRAEVLLPLRGGPRPRWNQRARYPSAALA